MHKYPLWSSTELSHPLYKNTNFHAAIPLLHFIHVWAIAGTQFEFFVVMEIPYHHAAIINPLFLIFKIKVKEEKRRSLVVIARSSPKPKKCKTRQKRKRSSSLSSLSSSDSASSRSFSLSPTPKKPSLQEKKSNRVRCTKKKKKIEQREILLQRWELPKQRILP